MIVKDGLKNDEVKIIIEKIRQIVSHFRRSNISNDKLMKYQVNMGNTPLKLILEVATRWNSSFYMLERFVKLEESIKTTLAIIEKEKPLPIFTAVEWKIVKELCLLKTL